MKNILKFFVCIITVVGTINGQNEIAQRASIYLEECTSFGEMVGVSGAIWKDGISIWKDGSGFRDMENQILADENMLHRIASISKPMTAIAVLQLWEKGLLDLDHPVSNYLPEFPNNHGTITIKHLLHQTSGIKNYKTGKEAFSTKQYNSLADAMAIFQNRPLANAPGQGFKYSTYNYVVLGAIIEAVSGLDYRTYMQKNIWSVAGMEDTDVEIFGESHPNKSKLYIKHEGKFDQDKQTNLSVKVPGGGIQSTVEDLLKFGQAVINHKLITEETYNIMITDSGQKKVGNPYGMGWFLYGQEGDPNGRIIGHSGSQAGTSTQFMIYLDHNLIVATIANTLGAWNDVYGLNSKLAQLVIDPKVLEAPIKKAIPMDITSLDRLRGTYAAEDGKSIEIYRKGKSLYASKEGFDVIELFASSASQFFARAIYMDLDFSIIESKKAEKLTIKEEESNTEYVRINDKKSIARELYNIMDGGNSAAGKKWFYANQENSAYHLDRVIMNKVGFELITVGEIKEALEVFKLNYESFPDVDSLIDVEKMISIGDQLLLAKYTEMAFAYYKFNVIANPNSWQGYYSIGKAYAEVGKKKKALKNLEKARALDPENQEVAAALAKI